MASSGVDGASERALAAQKQTVVLFPIANMVGPDKAEMADDLFILVKEGLTATGKFAVLAYDPKNVCVQRAVAEQHITLSDATDPFAADPEGAARAHKLCQEMSADLGIIGSLDNYRFVESAGEAWVTATLQIVHVSTGAIGKTVSVTGYGAGKPGEPNQTESGIGIAAAYDAAEKLLSEAVSASSEELSGTPAREGQTYRPLEESEPRQRNWLLPAMVTALIVGLVLGSS